MVVGGGGREHAIIKKSKLNHKSMPAAEFRTACEEFAEDYIQRQMKGFQRLGVVGDWENPYVTLKPEFEAAQIEVFGKMAEKAGGYHA